MFIVFLIVGLYRFILLALILGREAGAFIDYFTEGFQKSCSFGGYFIKRGSLKI